MIGQVLAALVLAAAIVAALVPLLLRDLRRAERRNFPLRRIRLSIEGQWQRDLMAFRIEQQIAMSILQPTDYVKIVGPVA